MLDPMSIVTFSDDADAIAAELTQARGLSGTLPASGFVDERSEKHDDAGRDQRQLAGSDEAKEVVDERSEEHDADDQPTQRSGPVMLVSLTGFLDAGMVGERATEHLLSRFEATRLATFDVDQLVDFRGKRTLMTFETDRWVDYHEPELVVDRLRDADGSTFLFLHGVEPDLQWERVIAAIRLVLSKYGAGLVVGFHGIPLGVPHTRPLTLTPHGTRTGLIEDYMSLFGKARVPASLAGLLEYRLGEVGFDAMGFSIHVPHYLTVSDYVPAAVYALAQVERVTGLNLDLESLGEAAAAAQREVEEQAAESPEVQAIVRMLEEQYDKFAIRLGGHNVDAEAVDIPSADELAAEFERYLAQRGD